MILDETYVEKAEKVIKNLNKRGNNFELTTSKIRNLLSMTANLYDESKTKDFNDLTDKIAYLRVQYVYQAGRETAVKDFVVKAELLAALKEIKDKETLQQFCRYMEALVAYFKYEGGKD